MTSKREWQRRAMKAEWEAGLQTRLARKRDEYFKAALDQMLLAARYKCERDTAIAERDRARDIAARLEGELARVRAEIATLPVLRRWIDGSELVDRPDVLAIVGEPWPIGTEPWPNLTDDTDPLTAPDPQHPAYKALTARDGG